MSKDIIDVYKGKGKIYGEHPKQDDLSPKEANSQPAGWNEGFNKEKSYSPTEKVKEDPARRAGRADDVKGEYPKVVEAARLAIEDCEKTVEEDAESLLEKVTEAVKNDEGKKVT